MAVYYTQETVNQIVNYHPVRPTLHVVLLIL